MIIEKTKIERERERERWYLLQLRVESLRNAKENLTTDTAKENSLGTLFKEKKMKLTIIFM